MILSFEQTGLSRCRRAAGNLGYLWQIASLSETDVVAVVRPGCTVNGVEKVLGAGLNLQR